MNNLNSLQFPDYYSRSDIELIHIIMRNAHDDSRIYNGSYKAEWLLSEFTDSVWITSNKGREEFDGQNWNNTNNVYWDVALPNGKRLLDEGYADLLAAIKKSCFVVRTGLTGKVYGSSRWMSIVRQVILFTRWIVLHENRFKPEKYGFMLVSQSDIDDLFRTLAQGGWFIALEVEKRIYAALIKKLPKEQQVQNFTEKEKVDEIIDYLNRNGFYLKSPSGAYSGKRYLDRKCLANLIYEDTSILVGNDRASAFLRQYEPDFSGTDLLVPIIQHHEYPNQNTPLINDLTSKPSSYKTLEGVSDTLNIFLSTHRHLVDLIPDPSQLSIRRSFKKVNHLVSDSSHTPFIPVNTGLKYFRHAAEWVNCYGEGLITCFEKWIGAIDFLEYSKVNHHKKRQFVDKARGNVRFSSIKLNSEKCTTLDKLIDCSHYSRQRKQYCYKAIRLRPYLEEAINILIGACITCIGIMKPSRNDEILHLEVDCLIEKDDGYYLRFYLGKSNVAERHFTVDKPIPYITAKAIKLLQRLSRCVARTYNLKGKKASRLFNIPSNSLGKAKSLHSDTLNEYLDDFCDYVNLPVDELGRRWYIRIHEMRKWFLLLLFWSGRYDVLDAARWIAGHTDASHLYDYIEREFPGDELPQIEAEYAIDRIIKLESMSAVTNEDEGIEQLYHRVLHHFNVESLSMIPKFEWEEYITTLRQEDGFVLEPHTIFGENEHEIIGINVSFILKEVSNG